MFSILLDNSFVELMESNSKNLGKAMILLTSMSISKQGKRNTNQNA